MGAMGVSGGLIVFEETVVGVALPTMRADLGMSSVAAHWVVSAYLLSFAGCTAAAGRLGDIVGLKTMLFVGLALFGLASAAAGFAQSGAWLITARVVQGVGAAAIFPMALAIIAAAFPPNQRGMAVGTSASIGTAFLAAGPLVSGVLVELVSWRWIFWINIPIIIIATGIIQAVWSQRTDRPPTPRLDIAGVATLLPGLTMVVVAIMQGADWGWFSAATLALMIGGCATIVLFVWIERRQSDPLIDVTLFANVDFSVSNLVVVVAQYSKIAVVIYVALYLQEDLKMSALAAGFVLLASVIGTPLAAVLSGHISDRIGVRIPTLVGLTVAAIGMAWIGLSVAWDNYLLMLPGLLIWGFSIPTCVTPAMRAAMDAAPPEKHGQANGVLVSCRLFGSTIGMALSSTIFIATGTFEVVLLVPAALILLVLGLAWRHVGRNP